MRHHPSTIIECEKPLKVRDLTSQTFTRLTVLHFLGMDKTRNKYWQCQCSCGQIRTVAGKHLCNGSIQSCGCLNRDVASARLKIHGESAYCDNTPEYGSFCSAKGRCNSVTNPAYPDYGERGIQFLFESYVEFLEYMGRKPSPQHSLGRIDNDGNYEKGNVRWELPIQQNQNTRKNQYLTANNETYCIAEWSRRTGINVGTMYGRLRNLHWCHHCIVTIPPRQGTCTHQEPQFHESTVTV